MRRSKLKMEKLGDEHEKELLRPSEDEEDEDDEEEEYNACKIK